MTVEALERAWRGQAGAAPMTPVMAFGPEGLTLGAGTVLAPVEKLKAAEAPGALDEARLFALLSAAYRQPIAPRALRYIRRGAMSWRDGDKAMAAMHLAMTGLLPLRDVKGAARRLFMAKISKNRPVVWFCHSQGMIDIIKIRYKKYGRGLENINFFLLP